MSLAFEMKGFAYEGVLFHRKSAKMLNFANGGTTVRVGILYGPSHILSISLLSWIYDTSG